MPLHDAATYPIWLNLLIFAIAAAIIWVAGSRLTRATDSIAGTSGLGHVFAGMLLLGGITSLPELANVLTASAIGNPGLAVNNLLGSAAINILLLAIGDAIVGRRAVTAIVAQPSTLMMGVACMIILIMIAAVVVLGDVSVGPFGVGSLTIGIASLGFFWLVSGHDKRSQWSVASDVEPQDEDAPTSDASIASLWRQVVISGTLLFVAGYTLSQIGDALAAQLDLTSAIVGFAFIGTATSLPELVTVIIALRLNRPEMAFGQVLGTNFVNLSLLPIGDLVLPGQPIINMLGSFEIVSALLGAILIGIFMIGLIEHRDRTIFKMGVDSAAVILIFALGSALLAGIPPVPSASSP